MNDVDILSSIGGGEEQVDVVEDTSTTNTNKNIEIDMFSNNIFK